MITRDWFDKIFPTKGLDPKKYNLVARRDELIEALNEFLPKYQIDSKKRVDAALSCWGVETDYFRTTEEYASGAAYEGRKDLGNTQKGDGKKFKGRGVGMETGRYNYGQLNKTAGKRLGIDFTANPEKLNEIPIAVESACIFWQDHNLNQYADAMEIKRLNGVVNRGDPNKTPLGWADRNILFSKCVRYIPTDITFKAPEFTEGVKPIDDAKLSFASDSLQAPTFKTVAQKAWWKIGGAVTTVWGTTGGKVAVILSLAIVAGGLGYGAYVYRKQLQLGWQIAIATIKHKVGIA